MERCFAELSPAERFAVYDYVVERAKATNKTSSVKLEDLQVDFEKKNNSDDRPPSHLEIKSKMRDYKRRRQSYRGKNVHITRKSYTEVLKEVIENQTEYLKQLMVESEGDNDRLATRAERGRSTTPAHERPSSEREHGGCKRKRSPSSKAHEKEERKSDGHRSREHKKKSHKHHKKHKRRKHSDSEDS